MVTCWKKKRALQLQIDAIVAASGKSPSRSRRTNKLRSDRGSNGSAPRQDTPSASGNALLAAEPAVQPPPLPADVPTKTGDYFEKNLVPSGRFWY